MVRMHGSFKRPEKNVFLRLDPHVTQVLTLNHNPKKCSTQNKPSASKLQGGDNFIIYGEAGTRKSQSDLGNLSPVLPL